MAKTKAKRTPLKLSATARKLYAERRHAHLLINLDPGSGKLSDEVADDARYQRAWRRELDRTLGRIDALIERVMSRPASAANLVDYALAASQDDCGEAADKLIGGIMKRAGLEPHPWPDWHGLKFPPEAEAIVRKLLGNRRPKRRALPYEEAERIAAKAAAEAVAKAEAAIKSKPGDAPLFAAAA